MPDFKDTPRGYKQKGWSAFTRKTDPVKKPVGPVTPTTQADYMRREVFNIIEDQKRRDKELDSDKKFDEKYNRAKKKKSPLKQVTDPPKKKKPVDDDTDVMTPKQERKHRRKVHQYNLSLIHI